MLSASGNRKPYFTMVPLTGTINFCYFFGFFSGLNVEKCRMSDHDQKPIFIYLTIWNSFLNKFYRVSLHEPHYGHLRPYICYMYLDITLILEKNIHFLKMSIKIWNIITPLNIFILYINWTFIHTVGELKDSTKRSVICMEQNYPNFWRLAVWAGRARVDPPSWKAGTFFLRLQRFKFFTPLFRLPLFWQK